MERPSPSTSVSVMKAEKRSMLSCTSWLPCGRRSARETKIEVLSDELVKPTVSTTLKDPLIPVSAADSVFMFAGYLDVLAWLPPLPSDAIIDYSTFETLMRMKLAATLSLFYPMAGRLVKTGSGMAINCNDAGVRFRIAKANYAVPEGLPTESFQKLRKLLGCNMNLLERTTRDTPLLFVQFTMFEDRRIAAFLSFHHGVIDGTAFCDFAMAWLKGAKIAQDPCHERSLLGATGKPGYPDHPVLKVDTGGTVLMEILASKFGRALLPLVPSRLLFPDLVVKEIAFTRDQLEVLKHKASCDLSAGVEYVTSSDVMTALIWRAVCRARGQPLDQEVRLLTMVNIRGRFPALPANYFGNAALPVATDRAKVKDLLAEPLGRTASRVREAIEKITTNADYTQETLNWIGAQSKERQIELDVNTDVDLIVSSITGMTRKGFDVGFGELTSLQMVIPRAGLVFLLSDARNLESDIIMQVSLHPKHARNFEDLELVQRFSK